MCDTDRHVWHATCNMWHVWHVTHATCNTCDMWRVAHDVSMSHIASIALCVTCHMSHVTRDMRHVWHVTHDTCDMWHVWHVPVNEICQRFNEFLAKSWLQRRQRSKLSISTSQHCHVTTQTCVTCDTHRYSSQHQLHTLIAFWPGLVHTAWWERHMPKIVTWKWNSRELNLQPLSHNSQRPNHYATRPQCIIHGNPVTTEPLTTSSYTTWHYTH